MVLDFDKYETEKIMLEQRKLIEQNQHVILLFTSPSGNGLKVVVRIPEATKETHPKYYKKFYEDFNFENFDAGCSNIDRVCYESYDPQPYFNLDATIYNPRLVDEGYRVSEKAPLIPITDEYKIIEKIMAFDLV